jgi:hypothetical protein
VPEEYYLLYLSTAVGESVRRSIVLVVAETQAQE